MTVIYFVRHAEPDYENKNDELRELTPKGIEDRKLVTEYLSDKNIDKVVSSPYKRAVDTVSDFAYKYGLPIECIDDFKERRVGSVWIDDFVNFSKAQWEDFNYFLNDGEYLKEVQNRNIYALKRLLILYKDRNVAVGSHGTALSSIINYFDKSFGYNEFERIKKLMPWIVEFTFEDDNCIKIKDYNVFTGKSLIFS